MNHADIEREELAQLEKRLKQEAKERKQKLEDSNDQHSEISKAIGEANADLLLKVRNALEDKALGKTTQVTLTEEIVSKFSGIERKSTILIEEAE